MTNTEPTEALKPCPSPWCNHRSFIVHTSKDHFYGEAFQGRCSQCNLGGPVKRTKAEAIAAWNTRAAPPAQVDESENKAGTAGINRTNAVGPEREDQASVPPTTATDGLVEDTAHNRLIGRIEYILEAVGTERSARLHHLTGHDLRCILTALKGSEHE